MNFVFFEGWKLALVFIALSPLTVIAFNITMRVCEEKIKDFQLIFLFM